MQNSEYHKEYNKTMVIVHTRLPKDKVETLDLLAEMEGRKRSQMVRVLLEKALKICGIKKK